MLWCKHLFSFLSVLSYISLFVEGIEHINIHSWFFNRLRINWLICLTFFLLLTIISYRNPHKNVSCSMILFHHAGNNNIFQQACWKFRKWYSNLFLYITSRMFISLKEQTNGLQSTNQLSIGIPRVCLTAQRSKAPVTTASHQKVLVCVQFCLLGIQLPLDGAVKAAEISHLLVSLQQQEHPDD